MNVGCSLASGKQITLQGVCSCMFVLWASKPPSRILHPRILKFNFEKGLEGGLEKGRT